MTPWKSASCPMGSSTGATPAPKVGADLGQRAVEVGPLAVELVDDDHPGHTEAGGGPPGVLGLRLHAVGGADDDDGQVDVGQRGDHLAGEVGVAGRVEQVDLDPVDGERGQAGRDGELARHLLGLEVHDGGALLDRSPPGDGPGGGQQRLGQGGLAGAVVADEGDVADCGRVVWHLVLRPPSVQPSARTGSLHPSVRPPAPRRSGVPLGPGARSGPPAAPAPGRARRRAASMAASYSCRTE